MLTLGLAVIGEELGSCESCQVLQESLDYERRRTQELELILFKKVGLVAVEEVERTEQDFKAIRPRSISIGQRRRELERKHRVKPEMTEAEKLFEEQLNASKVS